jgi:hypothetical protein
MRPPLAKERLSALAGYRYDSRHPWRDGTAAVKLSGLELIEKLVAIISAPRINLVRYHGTLAPNAKLRSAIVPKAKKARTDERICAVEAEDKVLAVVAKGYRWAELMRRV